MPNSASIGQRWLVLLVCGVMLGVPVFADGGPPGDSFSETTDDPLPVRRMLVAPDRLPAELQKAKQGILVQLPRAEFEERVARAARAGAGLKNPPRLIKASYKARLEGNALVSSSDAEWQIVNPQQAAGIVPLEPWNMAVRQARWADNHTPILASLSERGLGLLVEQPGEQTLYFSWTARGNPLPGGLHFDLKVPACAVASLELELPGDRTVTAPRESCLIGEPQALAPDRNLWRIAFAGQSQLDLTIRATAGQGQSLILSRLQTKQELAPGQVVADFDFDLEVLHKGIDRLVCLCDPGLRPYEVTIRNLEKWQFHAGANKDAPATLEIHLREPFQGEARQLLKVRCVAPLPTDRTWTCPGLQLVGAVPRAETILLRLDPDVQLEDWQPGSFRSSDAARPDAPATPRPAKPDAAQGLTLTAGLEAGPNPKRPSARIKTQGVEYRVEQLSWWQVGPERSALLTYLSFEITRGRLFQLPVLLPPGWEVDQVEVTPRELLRTWTILKEKNRLTLLVDLQRGLGPGPVSQPQLKVWLRPLQARPANARAPLPLPDVIPGAPRTQDGMVLGPRVQEGALAISVDPLYQAALTTTAVAAPVPERLSRSASTAPWGEHPPDHYFPYRRQAVDGGFKGPAIPGTLRLNPRPIRVRAQSASQVIIAAGRVTVISRLQLLPEGGASGTIDLITSAPVAGTWQWKALSRRNQVKSVQRLAIADIAPYLAALGSRPPLAGPAFLAARPLQGTWWRLTLARPLRERLNLEVTLELTGQGPAVDALLLTVLGSRTPLDAVGRTAGALAAAKGGDEQRRWDVPLIQVPSAESMDGTVSVYRAIADPIEVTTHGLQLETVPPRTGDKGVTAHLHASGHELWQTYRYGASPVALSLHGRLAAGNATPAAGDQAVAEQALLTVYAGPDGRLLNYYRFQLRNWQQRTFPLRLPAGARLLATRPDARTGQWAAAEPADGAAGPTVVFDVPRAAAHTPLWFDLVYALDRSGGLVGARLEAPAPVLPVQTLGFRQTWCLPPGLTPLAPGRWQRLPGPDATTGVSGVSRVFLAFAQPDDWADQQRQLLAEALDHLRKQRQTGTEWTLGRALEQVALDPSQEGKPLVLDSAALKESGLTPETVLPKPVTTEEPRINRANGPQAIRDPMAVSLHAGLVLVPCRPAGLVTTNRQRTAWGLAGGGADPDHPVSASIEEAVAQAILHGHDSSGRFRTVADWLQTSANLSPAGGDGNWSSLVPAGFSADWTEWEPLAGQAPGSLTAVCPDVLRVIGVVLTAVLLLAGVRLWHLSAPWRFRLLTGWLAAGCLALLWLPAPLHALVLGPTLAGLAVAVVHFVSAAVRAAPRAPARASPSTASAKIGAALLVVLGSAAVTARALAPAPATVLLVPGPRDAPAKQSVLVAPDLLKQLDTLTERGAAGLRGPVLLSARYQGQVNPASAQFEARFEVHNFAPDEQPASLVLPLAGIQLQEALLDGAAAFPRARPAPHEGYTIELKGRGKHTVVVRFTGPVAAVGEERELRFSIPRLIQSRLVLDLSAGARYVDTIGGEGAQALGSDPVQLKADLGRAGTLLVRWHQEGTQPRENRVRVQEAYLWDLRTDSARLLGLLQYHVTSAVTTFAIDLPSDVEVRSVDAEAAAPATSPAPRLKQWLVSGTAPNHRVRLQFQSPVSGQVSVTLELIPRQRFGPRAVLHFPTPLGDQATRGLLPYRLEPAKSFLAYRLAGVEAIGVKGSAIKGIPEKEIKDTFSKVLANPWRSARRETLDLPTGAFWSTPGGTPVLEMTLRAPAARTQGVQELSWHLGPRQADLRATLQLTDLDSGSSLVEWEVPAGVVVATVTGPEVRYWSRKEASSRVQIWLNPSARQATLHLTGWQPRRPQDLRRFDVPCLRLPAIKNLTTTVQLNTDDGLELLPERLQNLQPTDRRPGGEIVYTAQQPYYSGTFRLGPAKTTAGASLLTFVEVQDRSLRFNATLVYRPHRGDLRTLTLGLRNWDGEVVLHAPQVAHVRSRDEVRHTQGDDYLLCTSSAGLPAERSWTLELGPGVAGVYRLTLTGSVPLGKPADILMPDVRVSAPGLKPPQLTRWLALARPELAGAAPSGLEMAADPARALQAWPREADRVRRAGGSAWRVKANDWRLRLRPSLAAGDTAPVQLFLTEHMAAVIDGRHWIHQTTFWLYHEAGADLRISLPEGAAPILSVTVDGAEIPLLQTGLDRLWLRLPRQPGARRVRLSWMFPEELEPLESPRLSEVRLEGVAAGTPAVWTVHTPAGYLFQDRRPDNLRPRSSEETAPPPVRASAAGQDLRRAAAQLRLMEVVGPRFLDARDPALGSQLLAARERFDHCCREAEQRLAVPTPEMPDAGPDGQDLASWLQELRERSQQLARTYELDTVRAEVEKLPRETTVGGSDREPAIEQGTPAYWQGSEGQGAPELSLVAVQTSQAAQTWVRTLLLLAVLALAWALTRVSRATTWPEQIALLGCLGLLTFGSGWGSVFLVLPAVWLGVRCVWFVRWGLAPFAKLRPQAAPANP